MNCQSRAMSDLSCTSVENSSLDTVKILSETLQLPSGLCRNKAIFDEFFSLATWNSLSPAIRDHLLSNFLPEFFEDNKDEKDSTIEMLLSKNITRFDVCMLSKFQKDLANEDLTPKSIKIKMKQSKKDRRKRTFEECERVYCLSKKLIRSKENILKEVSCIKIEPTNETDYDVHPTSLIYKKSKKRYYEELASISISNGNDLSSDEMDEYEMHSIKIKKRRHSVSTVEK